MWEQIRANHRRSAMLVAGMTILLCTTGFVCAEAIQRGAGIVGLVIALVFLLIQLTMYFAAAESILMSGMGATEMQRAECPRLFNIVEEMRLASGLGYDPKIYLLDESAPNAFAVGRKPETSAIVVTTGLLYRLSRDELQGVVAHEMGHLKNQDIRFMMLAGVMLGSIVMLSDFAARTIRLGGARGSSRSSSRGNSKGGGDLVIVLLALALLILGPVLARILYFAISREREYLADASAAQFTRYPEGLASALLRIARANLPLPTASTVTAPMFIVNPMAAHGEETGWFSTHPSTAERVRILRAMSGASVIDYDKAFQAVHGGEAIGKQTLAAAQPVAIRPPQPDEEGITKAEAKAATYRAYGYLEMECECGAKLRVPETYGEDTVVCLRCGVRNQLPSVEQRRQMMAESKGGWSPPPPPQDAENAEPMHYVRQKSGWESFRCLCGGTVQLSPGFDAPKTYCPRCHRTIEVESAAA